MSVGIIHGSITVIQRDTARRLTDNYRCPCITRGFPSPFIKRPINVEFDNAINIKLDYITSLSGSRYTKRKRNYRHEQTSHELLSYFPIGTSWRFRDVFVVR